MKQLRFFGINYLVPDGFEFLDKEIDNYPSFCGAGSGIGDKVVPETIGGMRCSHICHAHDESWESAPATFNGFTVSNALFGFNLTVYLASGNGNWFKKGWRMFKGGLYVTAVSTIGWGIFKSMKGIG